jgi:hypothetical protein
LFERELAAIESRTLVRIAEAENRLRDVLKEVAAPMSGHNDQPCNHPRPRVVGETGEGLGTVVVRWCPDCGAIKRTMRDWRYTDNPWELPSPEQNQKDNT